MDKEELILQRYRPIGVMKGAELLLRHPDALRFIEDCKKLGLTILGLDFYIQEGNDITEIVGGSADFSSLIKESDEVEKSRVADLNSIKHGLPDYATWVSFVLEESRDKKSTLLGSEKAHGNR